MDVTIVRILESEPILSGIFKKLDLGNNNRTRLTEWRRCKVIIEKIIAILQEEVHKSPEISQKFDSVQVDVLQQRISPRWMSSTPTNNIKRKIFFWIMSDLKECVGEQEQANQDYIIEAIEFKVDIPQLGISPLATLTLK